MSLALLHQTVAGIPATRFQASALLRAFRDGDASPEQLAAALTALHIRGESAEVLTGFAEVLRESMIPMDADGIGAVDLCGTGGDGQSTVNLSTGAAFVVAGAGVPVAKHGNHGVSSRTGSADVLVALGIVLKQTPEENGRRLREVGLAFLYAPDHHPLFAKIGPVRRALGFRTAFNLLGPVVNPARVKRQVVGVFGASAQDVVAEVLRELGTERALVVHTPGPYDEVSLTAPARALLVEGGRIQCLELAPEAFGSRTLEPAELAGGDSTHNARILEGVLRGDRNGVREALCANAACALFIAGRAMTVREGFAMAEAAIDGGLALQILEALRKEAI